MTGRSRRVGDVAGGRAGDKGSILDLTLVAVDDESYARLTAALTEDRVQRMFAPVGGGPVHRHLVPGLRVLKFVLPEALSTSLSASLRAGVHWQKAAIWILLDSEVPL